VGGGGRPRVTGAATGYAPGMNREQKRAAERGHEPGEQDPKDLEQRQTQKLHQAGTPQDVADARAKNQRHGKVTADKWNQ
jgi:hypothetical protein